MNKDKMVWCIKQLLPLKYKTYYIQDSAVHYYTEWRMWFGKCFNIKKWEITKKEYDTRVATFTPPAFQVISMG